MSPTINATAEDIPAIANIDNPTFATTSNSYCQQGYYA
jgi:hypothetical protein